MHTRDTRFIGISHISGCDITAPKFPLYSKLEISATRCTHARTGRRQEPELLGIIRWQVVLFANCAAWSDAKLLHINVSCLLFVNAAIYINCCSNFLLFRYHQSINQSINQSRCFVNVSLKKYSLVVLRTLKFFATRATMAYSRQNAKLICSVGLKCVSIAPL